MGYYTTVTKVRERSGITSTELSDVEIQDLIKKACVEVNNQMNIRVERERVKNLGGYKQNKQDGSRTTFYTQNYPIADKTDDFTVGTADIEAFIIDSTGTVRTDIGVTAVSFEDGEITVDTAPESAEVLYFTYEYSPMKITDELVKKAAEELSCYYCVKRLYARGIREYTLGPLKIKKAEGTVGLDYWNEYCRTLNQIRNKQYRVI